MDNIKNMAKFRKIYTTIWNDEKFSNLSDEAQLIFLFLLTHPNTTWLGFLRTNIAAIAGEKEWDYEKTVSAFDELAKVKMVLVDCRKPLIFLPNWLKYNPPQNPNMAKSYYDCLYQIPECDLKQKLLETCRENLSKCSKSIIENLPPELSFLPPKKDENSLDFDLSINKKNDITKNVDNTPETNPSKTVTETVTKPFQNGMPNIEIEMLDRDIDLPSSCKYKILEGISLVGRNSFTNEEVVRMKKVIFGWNLIAERKNLRVVSERVNLNSERGVKLIEQVRDKNWQPFKALKKLSESDFLLGKVKQSDWYGKGASFDWFLKPGVVEQIIEGKYANALDAKARRRKALGLDENGNTK